MPQVRDPKTGRYTSGGDSSVGGAASTNPRIQKAAALGAGATVSKATPKLSETFASSSYSEAVSLAEGEFVSSGIPASISRSLASCVARDRADKMSEDGGTTFETFTPQQKTNFIASAESAFKKLGYSDVSVKMKTVAVAGSKSKLKYGGSTGATYEVRWSYKASK